MSEPVLYEAEPAVRWDLASFNGLLAWAVGDHRASDVCLRPGDRVLARVHGRWIRVTRRAVQDNEIAELLDGMTRTATASARVDGGQAVNFAHEVPSGRGRRLRFRGNATAVFHRGVSAANVVLRSIPDIPPTVEELGVEPEIVEAATPDNGLVLLTGVMGNGKSTTLAAILRRIAENEPRFIQTYEDPIEFDLTSLDPVRGVITQTEIGTHFPSFAEAVANTTRRSADVVLIGESRDPETLRGMIVMADVGVAVYSTVHSRSVEETPARILNELPHAEREALAATLVASLRLIVQQRLVPRSDGAGRVALREYLVFTPEVRERLMGVPVSGLIGAIREQVHESGRTLLEAADELAREGVIDRSVVERIETEQRRRQAVTG